VTAAIKLLQEDIKFVSTPILPQTLTSCTPTLEEAKVIGACPSQLDPQPYIPDNRYSFNCLATPFNCYFAYDYLENNYPDAKRIALLIPDDPGPNFTMTLIDKDLPERGMEVVSIERYPGNTEDFMPIVTKVLSTNPDAIDMIGGIVPWVTGIVNAARDLGFNGPIFASAPVGDVHQISAGIRPPNHHDFFNTAADVKSDKMPSVVKDMRKLVEQSGQEFNFDTLMPISSLWPIIQGIQKADSLDTDKVVEALENMEVYTPWSDGKAKFVGEEYGYHHLLLMEKCALYRLEQGGGIEFDFIKR
jgi:ABC-type branched-subunit amino acid transport system substrate-binding protein